MREGRKKLDDLPREDREDVLFLISTFLDPACHIAPKFARLGRELIHSPTLGDLVREVLWRAERLGIEWTGLASRVKAAAEPA